MLQTFLKKYAVELNIKETDIRDNDAKIEEKLTRCLRLASDNSFDKDKLQKFSCHLLQVFGSFRSGGAGLECMREAAVKIFSSTSINDLRKTLTSEQWTQLIVKFLDFNLHLSHELDFSKSGMGSSVRFAAISFMVNVLNLISELHPTLTTVLASFSSLQLSNDPNFDFAIVCNLPENNAKLFISALMNDMNHQLHHIYLKSHCAKLIENISACFAKLVTSLYPQLENMSKLFECYLSTYTIICQEQSNAEDIQLKCDIITKSIKALLSTGDIEHYNKYLALTDIQLNRKLLKQSKDNVTNANKSTVVVDPNNLTSHQQFQLVFNYTNWVLLAIWSFPFALCNHKKGANDKNQNSNGSSHNNDDDNQDNVFQSSHNSISLHIVTFALKNLYQLSMQQSLYHDNGSSNIMISLLTHTSKWLFRILCLQGRYTDQERLFDYLNVISYKFKYKEIHLIKTIEEMKLNILLRLAMNHGILNDYDKKTFKKMQQPTQNYCNNNDINKLLPSQSSASSVSIANIIEYVMEVIALFNTTHQYVDNNNNNNNNNTDIDKSTSTKSDFIQKSQLLYDNLTKSRMMLGLYIYTPWISLLCSKVLFHIYYDPSIAFIWAKQSITCKKSRFIVESIEHSFESMIFVAELHDLVGNIDTAFTYITEATSIAHRIHTISMNTLLTLHTMRIWYRIKSTRLELLLQDVIKYHKDENNRELIFDEHSKRYIIPVMQVIISMFGLITDNEYAMGDEELFKLFNSENNKSLIVLNYRNMNNIWDIHTMKTLYQQQQDNNSGDLNTLIQYGLYHSLISLSRDDIMSIVRHFSYASELLLLCSNSSSTHIKNNKITLPTVYSQDQIDVCYHIMKDTMNFDLIRDVKRSLCLNYLVQYLTTNNNNSNKGKATNNNELLLQQSFLLGASSCFTSLEYRYEKQTTIENNQHLYAPPYDFQSCCQRILHSNCNCNNHVELHVINNQLVDIIQYLNNIYHVNDSLLCFMTLDVSQQHIIVGTKSISNTIIQIIPIGHKIKEIIKQFNETIEESKRLLRQTMNKDKLVKSSEKDKKAWWKSREQTDEHIQNILNELESLLQPWISAVLNTIEMNSNQDDDINNNAVDDSIGDNNGNGVDEFNEQELVDKLEAMTVADVRKELIKANLNSVGRKIDLIPRYMEYRKNEHNKAKQELLLQEHEKQKRIQSKKGHIIFIFDEILQQLPFESMNILRYRSCSRIPNLALLLSISLSHIHHITTSSDNNTPNSNKDSGTTKNTTKLSQNSNDNNSKISNKSQDSDSNNSLLPSFKKCWYALDVENNLAETRDTMLPFLEQYSKQLDWKGVVGEIPSEDIIRSYHENSNLFIYCGHGAGDKLCDSYKLRKYQCPTASLLWGCSSGKLKHHGIHDPVGPAIYYLLGGSAFVLGNLWDVTDKDIDKLTIECMSQFLPKSGDNNSRSNVSNNEKAVASQSIESVNVSKKGMSSDKSKSTKKPSNSIQVFNEDDDNSHNENNNKANNNSSGNVSVPLALTSSRDVCKLKHAVGSAPVVYGVPINFSL